MIWFNSSAWDCGIQRGRNRAAFSLLELLVVLGIIAVLFSILLPALGTVRESANSVKCAAQEREILTAMILHSEQHQGYMPLTYGRNPASFDPASLEDPNKERYDYYGTSAGDFHLMSVMGALAPQLSHEPDAQSRASLEADIQSGTLRQIFHCPSDRNETTLASTVNDGGLEYSSYAFNEGPLGWASSLAYDGSGLSSSPNPHSRLRGKVSSFVHPERLFLFADASPRFDGWLLFCDGSSSLTLRDFFVTTYGPANNPHVSFNPPPGAASTWDLFDTKRHRGRMNVAFADGHVESISQDEGSLANVSMNVDFPAF